MSEDDHRATRRRSLTAVALWMAVGGLAVALAAPASGALPETPTPVAEAGD